MGELMAFLRRILVAPFVSAGCARWWNNWVRVRAYSRGLFFFHGLLFYYICRRLRSGKE